MRSLYCSLYRFATEGVDVVADHGDEEDDGPNELVAPLHLSVKSKQVWCTTNGACMCSEQSVSRGIRY